MATTIVYPATSWQQIATATTTVQITSGAILLQVQPTMPGSTDLRGHVVGSREDSGADWGAATAGEELYAKALQCMSTIVTTLDIW